MRWNNPPNWPVPPPGWTPPPGWQPDPRWGPPPTGWPLWLPDQPSGANNVGKALGIGCAVLVLFGIGAPVLLVLFGLLAADGSGSSGTAQACDRPLPPAVNADPVGYTDVCGTLVLRVTRSDFYLDEECGALVEWAPTRAELDQQLGRPAYVEGECYLTGDLEVGEVASARATSDGWAEVGALQGAPPGLPELDVVAITQAGQATP